MYIYRYKLNIQLNQSECQEHSSRIRPSVTTFASSFFFATGRGGFQVACFSGGGGVQVAIREPLSPVKTTKGKGDD